MAERTIDTKKLTIRQLKAFERFQAKKTQTMDDVCEVMAALFNISLEEADALTVEGVGEALAGVIAIQQGAVPLQMKPASSPTATETDIAPQTGS